MRNRCGDPSSDGSSDVSMLVPPAVRAKSGPGANVLKIAHGLLSNVSPKPTCWNCAFVKVATNSSDRPGENVAAVPVRAASTRSEPPPTVAPPPGPYRTVDQSAGTVPKNS